MAHKTLDVFKLITLHILTSLLLETGEIHMQTLNMPIKSIKEEATGQRGTQFEGYSGKAMQNVYKQCKIA